MSDTGATTVAVLDADSAVLAEKAGTLRALPGVDLRIVAESLGQLLTDPNFPPDLVIIEQRPGDRVSVNYKVRVCRLADARVIVVADGHAALSRDVATLMTPVSTFRQAVSLIEAR